MIDGHLGKFTPRFMWIAVDVGKNWNPDCLIDEEFPSLRVQAVLQSHVKHQVPFIQLTYVYVTVRCQVD